MSGKELEIIFKALGDHNRRRIIEILWATPNINVNKLCTHFEISRFAVMKHLRILENAGIVVSHRDAAGRHMKINPTPLKAVQDLWLNRFNQP